MKTCGPRGRTARRALLSITTILSSGFAVPALAQTQTTNAPVREFMDGNGVDLMTGIFTATTGIAVGDAENGLSFTREIRAGLSLDSMLGEISINSPTYTVSLGGAAERFTLSGGVFTPVEQRGSTLTLSGSTYTYTTASGMIATFQAPSQAYGYGNAQGIVPTAITYPNGKSLTLYYTTGQYIAGWIPNVGPLYVYGHRLQSVTSNTGYHIKFQYEADTITSSGNAGLWSNVIKVTGLNDLVDSCSPSAYSCTPSGSRPTLSINPLTGNSAAVRDYTDSTSQMTRYTIGADGITGIQLPGSSANDVTIAYTSGKVSSVTAAGVTTSYSYSDSGATRTTTVTRGSNPSSVFSFMTKPIKL